MTLDLTQAARLFYGDVEVAELHRDGQRLWPFGPELLGISAGASYYADPETMFSDAGLTPAALGEPVRQINDRAGTGINGGQSTLAARPSRARMPRDLRNQLTDTTDFTPTTWMDTNGAVTRSLPDRNGQLWASRVVPASGTRALNTDGLRASLAAKVFDGPMVYAADFKSDGLRYGAIGLSNGAGITVTVIFDLLAGTIASTGYHPSAGTGLTPGITSLGDGWFRCWFTFTQAFTFPGGTLHLTGSTTAASGVYNRDITGDGVAGVLIARPQVELGSSPTNAQIVDGNIREVIEPGVTSFDYVRFPTGSNYLLTAFPTALTGQVLVAGRRGSWVDNVILPAGWSFGMGQDPYAYGSATGWRGELRNGLYAVGSEIVGWTVREGQFAQHEVDRLLRDYGRKGAAGLMAPVGPNLVPNGNFDTDTGWVKAGQVEWADGNYTLTDVSGPDARITQQITGLNPDGAYLVEVDIVANAAGGAGFRTRFGNGAGSGADGEIFHPVTPFTGMWRHTIRARRSNPWISLLASNTGQPVTVSSISVRELVAQPLP